MTVEIHIIGLAVTPGVKPDALAMQALNQAELVIGSARQLGMTKPYLQAGQKQQVLPKLDELVSLVKHYQKIAVLASGDPLYYGIARWFYQKFPSGQIHTYPAVSSIQAACHALGLALQDVDVISLHGRPLQKIRTKLRQNQTLVVLSDKHSTPQRLAQECIAAGFDQSNIWVCENLADEKQTVRKFRAGDLQGSNQAFEPLHISIIKTAGKGGVLPEFPGIPDHHFVTDGRVQGRGMLSKREVRLQVLSLMQTARDDVIWDIGAGCGGVAVELAYWNEHANVFAVEHHAARLQCLEENREKFGVVTNLNIIQGRAPQALTDLPNPDKVFIGGSDGELDSLLKQVWQKLPQYGVLLASAVTETTRQQLLSFVEAHQDDAEIETLQVAVSKGEMLAGQLLYRPKLPVSLFRFVKNTEGIKT